jgi:hypothetical protein
MTKEISSYFEELYKETKENIKKYSDINVAELSRKVKY